MSGVIPSLSSIKTALEITCILVDPHLKKAVHRMLFQSLQSKSNICFRIYYSFGWFHQMQSLSI